MAIVRYARSADHLDRIFDQRTSSWFSGTRPTPTATPTVSADVRDGTLEVFVDLPGVPREAVAVEVVDRALTIKVEHKTERSQLSWARSLRLDRSLDAERVSASYADGRLTIAVPAAPKPEPKVVSIEIGSPDPVIDTGSQSADVEAPADGTPAAQG